MNTPTNHGPNPLPGGAGGNGTAGQGNAGVVTPFSVAATNAAARRLRDSQKALRATTVTARETEEKKRKEKEAAAEAARAAEENRKAEAARKEKERLEEAKNGMDLTDDGASGEDGTEGDMSGLEGVVRNLENEDASPVRKRRSVEVLAPSGGTYAAAASVLRASSFTPHTYVHSRVIIDGSVHLDQDDKFAQFIGQVATLITNGKIVDRFFAINPVVMGAGRKDWRDVKDISTNMTMLGGYVKISNKSFRVFEKKASFGRKSTGNYSDTVYFAVAISTDVEPSELVARILPEWMRAGGIGLYIKEIPAFNTVSPFVIFYLCNTVSTARIAEELKKMLRMGINLLADQGMEDGEAPTLMLPPFALRKNLPNLPGLDPKVYNHLTQRQKQSRRAWHLEMETHHVATFSKLIEVCKDYNVFSYWGDHVLISEAVDYGSPQGDIDRMLATAKRHTSFQCSMCVMQLEGIVDLDAPVKVSVGEGEDRGELTLRQILIRHYRTKDGESPLFAEVHQSQANTAVEAVVPNVKSAEIVVLAMNKHMAGYLKHSLLDRSLAADLVTRLVVASCDATLVAGLNTVTWDSERQEITTANEKDNDDRLSAFEKGGHYIDIDKLRISPVKKHMANYTAPEALFNLDETNSVTTLHAKNDAKRAAARKFVDGDDSEEEGSTDSASEKRTFGKSSNDESQDNEGGDGNKTISWSPHSSSEERLADRGAARGG